MNPMNTGAPHFKSVMKQYRHSNYTLEKVINEFIDNVIKKTNDIRISTQVDDTEKLQEIRISDNYINGFDNIESDGINNPFNMGHIKSSHDDDSETSEFGVGMKAGALSAANQLNVYTRITDSNGNYIYYEVTCDFIRMANEVDVNASYNPRIKIISFQEYKEHHPFECGSTLKLSKIRDCIYSKTTQNDITRYMSICISNTYSRFISRGIHIYVNESLVQPKYDFLEDKQCEPFIITKDLFILEKSGNTIYLVRKTKEMTVWQEFNKEKTKWNRLKEHNDGIQYIKELIQSGYKFPYSMMNDEGVCMQMNTVFTFYSNKYHTGHKGSEPELPEDSVFIYKDDRNYGSKSLQKHNNGINNYTLHEIEFNSKRLGKDIGITFNKEILMNGNNDLIDVIKAAISDSREEFTADTSVQKNANLCEKAIKKGLIDLMTCPEAKLSAFHRAKRIEIGSPVPSVSYVKTSKPTSKPAAKPHVESSSVQSSEDSSECSSETSSDDNQVKDDTTISEFTIDENVNDVVVDLDINKDIEDRKKRTIVIMDYLHKSISGNEEDILPNEILTLIENIFK